MKKITILSTILIFLTTNMFSLEVSTSELRNVSNATIEFINYAGPHNVINSVSAIRGIGSDLAKNVASNPTEFTRTSATGKYYVIHAVDSSQKEKLDADIIFIGNDATVDHIDNLRRIISGYLTAAYNYSQEDADTLAVFITVYNAVYRGNFESFKNKYKNVVTSNLSETKCGLSVNYRDWPGNSEIVIPLFDVENGGLSTVDTSVISDSKVVNSMKEDDDKNVETRKNMVDIKEREAENASENARNAQKTVTEEQKKVEEEKAKTKELENEAKEAQKAADLAQKEADENPDDPEAQQKAQEAQEQADEKQQELEEQRRAQEEQEEKVQEAKEEAKEQQALADRKQSEAQTERKEIAKDQKEVQQKEAELAKMPVEYAIVIADEANLLSKLVKFNKETGEIVKNSPVQVIRNRTIYDAGEHYIAIAGEEARNGTIKLVAIDKESMEITGESDYKIAADSVLVRENDEYYCVTNEDGKYFAAKFASDLSLKQKSAIQTLSCTPITITETGIVVTNASGKLTILNKSDFKEISSN